ncbi:MAG: phenylacetate--CoA ligase family protein [Anaerolineaceae bacterium]
MTETGLGGGVECDAHLGYHLREADLFFEIIDPQSGLPLPDGQTGEVVVTTLTRAGMPLVRYRTGDLSRILPGRCACGSFIRRLDKIRARVGAGIPMSNGLVFQTDLDEALFQVDGLLDFSARFTGGADRDILKLACRFTEEPSHQAAILDSLRQIPAVQAALDRGQLRVEISRMEYKPDPKTGYMFKRVLMDERP